MNAYKKIGIGLLIGLLINLMPISLASSAEATVISQPQSSLYQTNFGHGDCAKVFNSASSGGLALRVNPATGGSLIKRLPDGTIVRVTGKAINFGGYTWWPVNGGGWVAGNWIQSSGCGNLSAYTVNNQLNQAVPLAAGGSVQANALTGGQTAQFADSIYGKPGQFPLSARVTSKPGMRSAALYEAVIEQFAAGNNGRYAPTSGWTYCNTFAGDVMRAMGVPLPVKSGSDPATKGATDLYNWLVAGNGWTRIYPNSSAADMQKLIAHVNAGKPALAATSGHIAVIRPGQATNLSSFKDLKLAQAGAINSNNLLLKQAWTTATPAFFIRD